MNSQQKFPLITLQPVADAANVWVSFVLSADAPFDRETLARLFNGFGLSEILGTVSCEARIDPTFVDAAFAEDYPAGRLMLRVPGEALQTPASLSNPGKASASKGDPSTRSLLLKLLSLVTSDADSAEIEALIKRDPNLSYHLLKMVNSVAFASSKKITNFGQAIALLGRRQLQRWLQLLLYARPQGSIEASPLLPRAALRASLMEALAKRRKLGQEQQDNAFMAGMFSLLEALFGTPLAEIIGPLNLDDEVMKSLTGGEGALAGLFAVVQASEGEPGPALAAALAAQGIEPDAWASALVDAVRWTVQVSKEA